MQQQTYKSFTALLFAFLSFAALFHLLVLREVYPGYFSNYHYISYSLAALWCASILASRQEAPKFAPLLALGYFAALTFGVWMVLKGRSSLMGSYFVIMGLLGVSALGRLYFEHLPGKGKPLAEPSPYRGNTAALRAARM